MLFILLLPRIHPETHHIPDKSSRKEDRQSSFPKESSPQHSQGLRHKYTNRHSRQTLPYEPITPNTSNYTILYSPSLSYTLHIFKIYVKYIQKYIFVLFRSEKTLSFLKILILRTLYRGDGMRLPSHHL